MSQLKALAAQAQAVAQQAEILAMQAAALSRQAETVLGDAMDRDAVERVKERPYGEGTEKAAEKVFFNRHKVGEADSRSGVEPATTHKE